MMALFGFVTILTSVFVCFVSQQESFVTQLKLQKNKLGLLYYTF